MKGGHGERSTGTSEAAEAGPDSRRWRGVAGGGHRGLSRQWVWRDRGGVGAGAGGAFLGGGGQGGVAPLLVAPAGDRRGGGGSDVGGGGSQLACGADLRCSRGGGCVVGVVVRGLLLWGSVAGVERGAIGGGIGIVASGPRGSRSACASASGRAAGRAVGRYLGALRNETIPV